MNRISLLSRGERKLQAEKLAAETQLLRTVWPLEGARAPPITHRRWIHSRPQTRCLQGVPGAFIQGHKDLQEWGYVNYDVKSCLEVLKNHYREQFLKLTFTSLHIENSVGLIQIRKMLHQRLKV